MSLMRPLLSNWTVYMARIEVKNGNQIDMWNDEDEIGLCA